MSTEIHCENTDCVANKFCTCQAEEIWIDRYGQCETVEIVEEDEEEPNARER